MIDIITNIVIDLVSKPVIAIVSWLLGLLFAKSFFNRKRNKLKKWWNPESSSIINILPGKNITTLISQSSEIEPVVNLYDAIALGELRRFLEPLYDEVNIALNESQINWQGPTIVLGGPCSNSLSERIENEIVTKGAKHLPVWFVGKIPDSAQNDWSFVTANKSLCGSEYAEWSLRGIDTLQHIQYNPLKRNGLSVEDIGIFARIFWKISTDYPERQLFIIAGCRGIGTLGVVRHLSDQQKLLKLPKKKKQESYQFIVRTYSDFGRITNTEFINEVQFNDAARKVSLFKRVWSFFRQINGWPNQVTKPHGQITNGNHEIANIEQ